MRKRKYEPGDVDLLCSPLADAFTRCLDANGWMIIRNPRDVQPGEPGPRWFLNEPSDDCPDWCDNGIDDEGTKEKRPTLKVIIGGKEA